MKLLDQDNRFLKFAIVGISGTIVDFGFFNLFSLLFGLPVVLSSVLSFSIAVFNNFYWNRIWTYPESRQASLGNQLIKFGIVSVLGLIIRTPMFALIEEPLIRFSNDLLSSGFFVDPEIVGHNIALASVIIVVLFWNYFVNRFWTYRDLDFLQGREENGS
jgi:putative flippase GtrA